MTVEAEFSLSVRIIDKSALARAAAIRAVEDGAYPTEEAYLEDPGNDEDKHLVMLLDPGWIPGCEVQDSGCESRVIEGIAS